MDKPLVIFDGDCGICTWSAEWIEARDSQQQALAVEPYQTTDLERYDLTPEQTSRSVYLALPDGTTYKEARAVFETLKRLPGIYGVVGALLANPAAARLARPVYRWVARNRTTISQRLGMTACALPDAG
jgi:predicted DCC family thiol-disulfide oxidoreductase YuxK